MHYGGGFGVGWRDENAIENLFFLSMKKCMCIELFKWLVCLCNYIKSMMLIL